MIITKYLLFLENWSKTDRIRQIKLEETIHVYEDDNILCVIPKSLDSACLYGKGTKWCYVSNSEKDMVDDGRMARMGWQSTFDEYNERDTLYIFIDKKNNKKYTFMFEDGRFVDELEQEENFAEFMDNYPKLKEILIGHIKNGTYHRYPYPNIHLDMFDKKLKGGSFFGNPFDLKHPEFD